MEKIVQYFGNPCKVACDGNCKKAWGINQRPKEHISGDDDDVVFLSDSELGEAPENPGTYEGGQGKPRSKSEMLNKWCFRECERSAHTPYGGNANDPLVLPDWSKLSYNIPASDPQNAT